MNIVREQVEEWVIKGYVEKIDYEPFFINPLTVATKNNGETGAQSFRVCCDLSRSLNELLEDCTSRLDDLKTVWPRITEGCFFSANDIRAMYLHLSVNPRFRDLFGFAVVNSSGVLEFYRYMVIPFGLRPATTLMATLMRPIILFLHEQAIDLSYYVDDGITIQDSFTKCQAAHDLILFVLKTAGWEVAMNKCTVRPVTKIVYLGFIICSKTMRVCEPQMKVVRLVNAISTALRDNKAMGSIPNKQLAEILGVVCHLLISHGEILRVATRLTQHTLGKAVQLMGWTGVVCITEEVVFEMQLCQKYLVRYNSQPIRREEREVHVLKPAEKTYLLQDWDPNDDKLDLSTIVSDSSDTRSFIYEADSFRLAADFPFNLTEQSQSSSLRELYSIKKLFESKEDFVKEKAGKGILWLTDSQVMVWFLKRGSKV